MNDYVFCLFCIDSKNGDFVFNDEEKEKMKGFGDFALLITNEEELFKRIQIKLKEKNYKSLMKRVKIL